LSASAQPARGVQSAKRASGTGTLRFYYSHGGQVTAGRPPEFMARFLRRAAPSLDRAADLFYCNDETLLSEKLTGAVRLLRSALRPADFVTLASIGARLTIGAGLQAAWARVTGRGMVDGRWLMGDGDAAGHQPSTIDHRPSTIPLLSIEQKLNTIAYTSGPVSH